VDITCSFFRQCCCLLVAGGSSCPLLAIAHLQFECA
jgi:hypothetical protein